jgi:hypothetical protein
LVDHTENTRARADFAENSLAQRSPSAPGLLKGVLRPQVYFLDWLVRRAAGSVAGLVLVGILAAGFFFLYLGKGPIAIAGLAPRITQALDQKIGHGYAFRLGEVSIRAGGFGPTLSVDHLSLTSSSGETIITAPRAEVSVDLFALAFGKIIPKRLEVFDVEVHLALLPDGSLAVSAGNGREGVLPLLGPLSATMGTSGARPAMPAVASTMNHEPRRSLIVKRIAAAMRLLIDISTKPNGPLAAIDRVGIARGHFVIEDRLNEQTKVYDGLDLALDKSNGGTNLDLSAEGPSGPWSVSARASGNPGGERRLDVEFRNISLDEITIVSGLRDVGADFDMPVSSKFSMVLGADRKLADVSGQVHFDPGYLRFEDPNDEPRMIDSIDAGFHWDRAGRRIVLDNARLRSGRTDLTVGGAVAPPIREGEPWTVNLTSSHPGVFGVERPGEEPIAIDHIGLQGRLAFDDRTFFIDRFEFNGPNCGLAMAGSIDWKNGPHIRLGASISPTPAVIAVRLWPSFMAPDVRAWFLAHWKEGVIERGTMQVDFSAAMIDAMRHQYAPPDSAVAIDFALSDGATEFLPGVPLLRGIDGSGHVTGHTSIFRATKGYMDLGNAGKLTMTDGVFHIGHAEIKPTLTELSAKVSGDVSAVGDLLSRDALKPYASLPVDPSTLQGQIAGSLGLDLSLGPGGSPADTKLRINAVTSNFSAEKLVGDAKLEDAILGVVVDQNGLKVSGPGKIFGAPANIDITMPPGSHVGQATISLIADDALLAKQGLAMLPGISGPVGTRVTVPLGAPGPMTAQVDLDITHTAIDTLGISKPSGRPGKVSFMLTTNNDHSTSLDQIVVDAAPVEARGSVNIGGADPSQISAKFSQIKLSPDDDMKLDASKVGDTLKLIIRANAFDARPFLKTLTLSHAEENQQEDAAHKDAAKELAGANLDIDLKAADLSGFNEQTMSNVDLHITKNGDDLQQFALVGKFGDSPIYGNLDNADTPAPQLDLSTSDAGALLAFIDLYHHMDGGQLAVTLRLGQDAMVGTVAIHNFVLRDEPALQRLVAEGAGQSSGEDARSSFDPNAVQFTRLQVNFQRAGTRLDLRDGTIYGPQLGLTVDGWLDFGLDRVALNGTFVPAYGVNNLVSQIPIFGLLLGGGLHEGLFAVNYRITGAATKPTLNFNLLTAIAPGILRKIFGATTDFAMPDGSAATPGSASDPSSPPPPQ